jgi:prepilin-type N-terminal cleavage/methylation domain-containing protein
VIRRRLNLRSERGFTLVELLAAMAAGVVVLMAALTVLDVSIHQTTRTFSLVDATSRAEPAFEAIENELHSACFADEETPIQAGSSGTALIFVTSVGNAATPVATWHEIDFNTNGNLVDNSYSATESSVSGSPAWTRGTLQNSRIVLTNTGQTYNTATPPTKIPVFQYFAYQQAPATDAAGNNYMILPDGTAAVPGTSSTIYNPLVTGTAQLTSAQAASAAEVLITLVVGPGGQNNENTTLSTVNDTVTDSIVLRLTPASNNTADGGTYEPCE